MNSNNAEKNKNLYWKTPTVYFVDGRQVFISNNYPLLSYKIIKVDKIDKIKSHKKHVSFNLDKTQILNTYSAEEYDRGCIDSIMYLRTLQRINQNEWNNIVNELNDFKKNEMVSHKDSLHNLRLHK